MKRHRRREPVPVHLAQTAYDRLRNWRKVADEIRRVDGTKFTPQAICAAVGWAHKQNAGFRC